MIILKVSRDSGQNRIFHFLFVQFKPVNTIVYEYESGIFSNQIVNFSYKSNLTESNCINLAFSNNKRILTYVYFPKKTKPISNSPFHHTFQTESVKINLHGD